jgi:hypothetical protein
MTAATATDPILEAVLAERWHMATTDVREFVDKSVPREINSEAETDLIDARSGLSPRGWFTRSAASPRRATSTTWNSPSSRAIEEHILDFARQIETLRADAQKPAAA